MKRSLIVSLVVVVVAALCSPLPAACRVQRVRNVHQQRVEAKIVVPFAVPVAVPVAVVSPYFYSYSQFESRSHASAWERAEQTHRVDAVQSDSDTADSRRGARAGGVVSQHCVTCHGGASPQGGLSLERAERLSLADRLRAIRAVLSRRMPKGAKLDDEQLRAVVEELTDMEDY